MQDTSDCRYLVPRLPYPICWLAREAPNIRCAHRQRRTPSSWEDMGKHVYQAVCTHAFLRQLELIFIMCCGNLPCYSSNLNQGVSKLLVQTDQADLEPTSRKFKRIFEEGISNAAETGTCSHVLHVAACAISAALMTDVQVLEGNNSLLKTLTERCHNIGLPLLSARCVLKKGLGVGSRGSPGKWSSIKQRAGSIIQSCLDSQLEVRQVMETPGRWDAPLPTPALHFNLQVIEPGSRPNECVAWAIAHNALWHKAFPHDGVSDAILICNVDALDSIDSGPAFFSVERNFSVGMMAVSEWQKSTNGNVTISLSIPLQFKTSVAMFQDHYASVRDGASLSVIKVAVTWDWTSAAVALRACRAVAS